jgi:hypothetical protein
MTTTNLRFSWKAMVLAPLAVPLIAALVLAAAPSKDPLWGFLFFLFLGGVFSYGVSLGLFLPSLFVLSRFIRLTAWRTGLLGLVLGLLVYLPVARVSYGASGDDSGPPTDTFVEYLMRNFWAESWIFLVGGLVMALLYWLLASPRVEGAAPSAP